MALLPGSKTGGTISEQPAMLLWSQICICARDGAMEEQTRTPEKLTKVLQSIHVLRLDQKMSKMECVGDIYKKGNHKYNTIKFTPFDHVNKNTH